MIDTKKDKVVQTIDTKPWPSSDTGYEPTSIAMTADNHLLVTLGRANAVAVYQYEGDPLQPVSYIGLLPTDYYPADVATVGSQHLRHQHARHRRARPEPLVQQGRGHDRRGGSRHARHDRVADALHAAEGQGHREDLHQHGLRAERLGQEGRPGGRATRRPPRCRSRRASAIPSTIKHVFLLVKENRTYDQVYGDMTQGNGDPTLAQFGAKVTPNQHALAKQFGLYDNTYDVGTNSAEGHNWLMQGDNPEYTESSAGEYIRSYDTEEDVLGHQRSGFLWTAVEDAGNTARNYGEFEYTEGKPAGGTWQQYYCASKGVEAGGDPAQLTAPEPEGQLRLGDPVAERDRRSPVAAVRHLGPGPCTATRSGSRTSSRTARPTST